MEQKKLFVFNGIMAQKAMRWFTLAWIGQAAWYYYFVLLSRPDALFTPQNLFGILFAPSFPSVPVYTGIALIAMLSCILLVSEMPGKGLNLTIRIVLSFSLLWMNNVQWSYGYTSHVRHLLLLAHLFSWFLPSAKSIGTFSDQVKAFRYYYVGLMLTYTFSACWKILYVIKDLMAGGTLSSWLDADALLNTAVAGHVWMEEPVGAVKRALLEMPGLSEAGFWLMTLVMLLAPLSVRSYKNFQITLCCLILFHLANNWLIRAEFFVSPILLLLFAVPYHRFMNNKYQVFQVSE